MSLNFYGIIELTSRGNSETDVTTVAGFASDVLYNLQLASGVEDPTVVEEEFSTVPK